MAGMSAESGDLDIDVARLFASLWRNKGRLMLTALVLTGLTAAILFAMKPKFKAETRIFIEQQESIYTRPEGSTAEDTRTSFDNEGVTSQVQLITSADVLSRAAASKALANSEEFQSLGRLGYVDQVLALLNRGPQLEGTDLIIAKMREQMSVYRVENSRVIVVEFSAKDPSLAAAVPNAVAEAYLAFQADSKLQNDSKATTVLKAAIDKLEVSLPKAEGAVSAYRSQNDILVGTGNSALATQQLSELSTELSRVRANRANAQSRAETIETLLGSGGSIDSVPEILSSGLIQRLRESQVRLKSQIADLSTTLLDGHPQIKGLRSQLTDLDSQIRSETAKILRSVKTEAQAAANREEELTSKLNGLKVESSRVSDDEVKLRELEREVASQRDQLESYKSRYREALDRQAPDFQSADARVIQRAEMPGTAYFPKYVPSLAAAFVGSLLLMSVITLLRELFSGRAFRAAAIPAVMVQDNSVIAPSLAIEAKPTVEEAQQIVDRHATIAAVAGRLIDDGETSAMIVSPEGGVACASSVLIARNLADLGLRVVLLDLSGASSAAKPMLDGLAMPGITNLLAGETPLSGVVHVDVYSDAFVIPTGTADAAKAAKSVTRLPMIINALTTAYDMVIIECGAATAAGLRRIVMPGSRLFVSIVNPDSDKVLSSMTDLVAAGYDELDLVTPDGAPGATPQPGRSAA